MPINSQNLKQQPADVQAVVIATCNYYNITPEQLTRKSRKRYLVDARKIAMTQIYFRSMQMNGKAQIGLEHLASLFNYKDHSSVIHARDSCMELIETEKIFDDAFHAINKAADDIKRAPDNLRIMEMITQLSQTEKELIIQTIHALLDKTSNKGIFEESKNQ